MQSGGRDGRESADSNPPDARTGRETEASADIIDLFRILRAGLGTIAGAVILALLCGLAYLLATPKLYTASTSILFDAPLRTPLVTDQAYAPQAAPDATLVESQVELMSSPAVLRRVVQDLDLVHDPEFSPRPGLLARLLGLGGSSSPASDVERAEMALAHNIEVKRSQRTYVVEIDVSARQPREAQRLANAVAKAYFEDQQAARSQFARRDSAWLDARVADLKAKVDSAERKLTQFRSANGINEANGKNVSQQQLADLATQMVQAHAQTAAAKARADHIRSIEVSGRLPDGTSDALKSATLDRLRAQYADLMQRETDARMTFGDRHPALLALEAQARDTQRLIAQELRRIAAAAQSDYQIARANEAAIAARLAAARKSEDENGEVLSRLGDLQREADAARATYEQFLRARQSLGQDATPAPSARVIAPASLPLAPSSPKKSLILGLALILGLFFGAGLVLVRDLFRRATGPERAPNPDPRGLVAVPRIRPINPAGFFAHMRRWSMRTRAQEMEEERQTTLFDEVERRPRSPFSVAIRQLWEELSPPRGQRRRPWTILVASLSPGVGKTTIAANLARAAAIKGARVLLIEANARNPQLWRLIDEESNPGLIDMSGAERVIYRARAAGEGALHFVPIMSSEQRTVRRLRARSRIPHFEGISGRFDVVVVDGPSADDLADLRDLASTADRIALTVTGAERDEAVGLLEELQPPSRRGDAGVLTIVEDLPEAA